MAEGHKTATHIDVTAKTVTTGLGPSKLSRRMEETNHAMTRALGARVRMANHILRIWEDILNNPPEGPMRWADYIRTSELVAKHLGMLEDMSQGPGAPRTVLDVRSLDERQLLAHLSRALNAGGPIPPAPPAGDQAPQGDATAPSPEGRASSVPPSVPQPVRAHEVGVMDQGPAIEGQAEGTPPQGGGARPEAGGLA